MWQYVIPHFQNFLHELELPVADRHDAESKAQRVAKSLFAEYYPDQEFDPTCYAIVGSYGKGTAAKPRSDVDMIFVLPPHEFMRIQALSGNKQSQLLLLDGNQSMGQAVRCVCSCTSGKPCRKM